MNKRSKKTKYAGSVKKSMSWKKSHETEYIKEEIMYPQKKSVGAFEAYIEQTKLLDLEKEK